jgi:hypothetical protein
MLPPTGTFDQKFRGKAFSVSALRSHLTAARMFFVLTG